MEEIGWDDLYCQKLGIVDPSGLWDKDGNYAVKPEDPEYPEIYKVYKKYRDECRKAVDKLSVNISSHCSCDYPIYFVSLNRVTIRANKGYPKTIDQTMFNTISEEEIQAMKDFCKIMEIPWQEPDWYLASNWC